MTGVRDREVSTARITTRRGRVVWLLARREARRLVRHPFVLLGAGLVVPLTFAANLFSWSGPLLARDDAYAAMMCAPLALGTMLAANLATTRSRRDDADELFEPAPAERPARTAAHLLSLAGPVVLAVVLAGAWLAWAATRPGAVGSPEPAHVLHGPALVLMGGAVGVMVGRWTPLRVAPALVGAILVYPLLLADNPGSVRWLAWFRQPSGSEVPELSVTPVTAHLAYLIGIALVAGALASLRHGPAPRRLLAVGLAVLLTAGSVGVQFGVPTEHEVEAAFDLAEHPEGRHRCRTRTGVESCVWPGYEVLAERWEPLVAGAVAPLPERLRPHLRVELRPGLTPLYGLVGALPDPDDRERWRLRLETLSGQGVPAERGDRRTIVARPRWPGPQAAGPTRFEFALAAAVRASGFDPGPTLVEREATEDTVRAFRREGWWPGQAEGEPMPEAGDTYVSESPCTTAGQARSVVALWLAAQATDATRAFARLQADPARRFASAPSAVDLASPWLQIDAASGFVNGDLATRQWAIADLELAAQLLDRDPAEVVAALTMDWGRWTDPDATSGQLQQALGLDPPRTAEQRLAAAGLTEDGVPAQALDPEAWGVHSETPACA